MKEQFISGLKEPNSRPDLVLVNSPINDYGILKRPDTEQLPAFGLAHIATECEAAGFNVGLIDVETLALSPEEAAEIINNANPRWVGINLLTPTLALGKRIIKSMNPEIPIAAGAAHAKAMPEKVLRDPDVGSRIKLIALEDGEYIMRGLLQGYEPSQMGGVSYINGSGDFIISLQDPERKWIPWELDEMGYANRKFLPGDPFSSQGRLETNMVGSRGCPFQCKFCAGARERLIFGIRNRSPQDLTGELEMLRDHNINAVRFIDDLFLANKKRIEGFFEYMIKSGLNKDFVWDATGRVNTLSVLDNEMIENIALSGCREVSIGVESASRRVLNIMEKNITPEMVEASVVKLARVGIRIKGYFILGTPSETSEEMEQSVQFMHYLRNLARETAVKNPTTPLGNKNTAQFRGSMFEFRPYPGTELYDYITGKKSWPDGVWSEGEDRYMYTEDQILDGFKPVIMEGLEERQKHNYTTDLPFSEVQPRDIQRLISDAMSVQRRDMEIYGEYLPGIKEADDGTTIFNRETESV